MAAPVTASPPLPFTVADTLDRIAAARLTPPLVDGAAYTRLRAAAAHLPAALAQWIHVECRLGADGRDVDLIVRVDERGRDLLASGCDASLAGDGVRARREESIEWQRATALSRRWIVESRDTLRPIARLWLEFDLPHDGRGGVAASPGVFVELAHPRTIPWTTGEFEGVCATVLPALLGDALPAATRRAVQRCVGKMPPGAALYALAVFTARSGPSIRLCVIDLAPESLESYLHAVGWAGSLDALRPLHDAVLAGMSPGRQRVGVVHLDLDAVDGSVGRRLGLEYVFDRGCQYRGRIAELAVLDAIVAAGHCAAAKRDALLRWPGAERRMLPHELWPSLVLRRVNHVKLTLAGDRVEAKAYLCCAHEPWHARVPSGREWRPTSM